MHMPELHLEACLKLLLAGLLLPAGDGDKQI